MLGVTKVLCGTATPGDALRYGRDTSRLPAHLLHYSADKKPIVVWNITRRCNLRCVHCYSDSCDQEYAGEMSTQEGRRLIDDLADYGVPTLLFSGGEPLLRQDLWELAAYARQKGLRTVLSTNGTLIGPEEARRIREAGFSYVGVSIDGAGETHDRIRGRKGSFQEAVRGIRNCQAQGVRTGLRFTVHRLNVEELPAIFRLLEEEDIPRLCVYHLAYAGRGDRMQRTDLDPPETRRVVDAIFSAAVDLHRRGVEKDILTVDNHADNAYAWMRVLQDEPERADDVKRMLEWNGGNQSGIAIACVDNVGEVHADQFSWHYSFGNVRERRFAEIWEDRSDPVMEILKDRSSRLKGRCGGCRFLKMCNGNLRVRAERYWGDWLAPDPACYLTDEEIGVAGTIWQHYEPPAEKHLLSKEGR
jgi:radical SAM protein with 4Fe4S-binding SPASM domain